jgi:hypothetical protein
VLLHHVNLFFYDGCICGLNGHEVLFCLRSFILMNFAMDVEVMLENLFCISIRICKIILELVQLDSTLQQHKSAFSWFYLSDCNTHLGYAGEGFSRCYFFR